MYRRLVDSWLSSMWGFDMASRNRWYDYAVAIWLGFVLLMVAALVAVVIL